MTNQPHRIDVHAHVAPEALLERVGSGDIPGVRLDGRALVAGDDRTAPLTPPMTSTSARLAWMDEEGIAEQWVSPWLDLFTWHRRTEAEERSWIDVVNNAVAEQAKTSGGRLLPVPYVEVAHGSPAALDSLQRLVAELHPPAIMINSAPRERSIADPDLEDFWSGVADCQVPVLLHPPGNGPSCAFTAPALQNVSGRVIDASAAVMQLLAAGVFDRLPDLRVIVVHGGGFLPYQAFRLDGLVRAGLLERTRTARPPSDTLRRLWFDTVALDGPSIELLVRRVGAGRVLLGSDAPFPIGDPHPARTVEESGLSPEVVRCVCGDNAVALRSTGAASAAGHS